MENTVRSPASLTGPSTGCKIHHWSFVQSLVPAAEKEVVIENNLQNSIVLGKKSKFL